MRKFLTFAACLALAGCGTLRGEIPLLDGDAVRTPVYTANKVLYMDHNGEDSRYAQLKDGYEMVAQAQTSDSVGARRSIRNRQPLSIVVSRAYVPATLKSAECRNTRASDLFYPRGRDIAVLLDMATGGDQQGFVAVWYQQDVPPDELLSFGDLLVYSSDAWDAKFPPYFRLRLVDVSAERNTALGELLTQIRASSSSITGLLGVNEGAPLVNIASLAARQVLANDRNRALVDFTFQLYGAHLLGEAGGMPLGVLQTGGMMVTALPCGQKANFWNTDLKFDHRLGRILNASDQEQAMPYISATIMTADLSVPQVVRSRTAAISRRLTDPAVVQSELKDAMTDAARLSTALAALNERESFRRRPSKEAFTRMITSVRANWKDLDGVEQGFFLDAFYQITGASLPDADAYEAWAKRCVGPAQFLPDAARFKVDETVKDADGKACWTV